MIEKIRPWIRYDRRHVGAGLRAPFRHRRLDVEQLESRSLLSGTVAAAADEGGFVDITSCCEAAEYEKSWGYAANAVKSGWAGSHAKPAADIAGPPTPPTQPTQKPEAPQGPRIELLSIAPEELQATKNDGGMIDLTRVVNQPVRMGEPPPAADGAWLANLTGVANDPGNVRSPPETVAMDGSRGRCQAFELAMLSDWDVELSRTRPGAEFALPHAAPSDAPVSPADPSEQNSGAAEPDAVRRPEAAHQPDAHGSQTDVDSAVSRNDRREPSQTPLPADAGRREERDQATVADTARGQPVSGSPAGTSDLAFTSAVYLDNQRRGHMDVLLSIPVVSLYFLAQHRAARDERQTSLVPVRRPELSF